MAHAEATKGRNIRGLAVYTRGTQAHPGPHCYVHKWFNSNVLYDPHQAAPIPAPAPPPGPTPYIHGCGKAPLANLLTREAECRMAGQSLTKPP